MNDEPVEGETPTPELKIHIPIAASVAEGAPSIPSPAPREPRHRDEEEFTPRLRARPLAERLAAQAQDPPGEETRTGTFVLPDWTEPPTGLVPKVLLDEDEIVGIEGDFVESGLRGPSWREAGSDWDNDADLAFLIDESEDEDSPVIAGQIAPPVESPFGVGFEELEGAGRAAEEQAQAKWDAAFGDREMPESVAGGHELIDLHEPRGAHHLAGSARRRRPRRVHGSETQGTAERNVVVATGVGLAIGLVAVACFKLGAPSTLALAIVAVTLAAAELFSSLQRAGYRPATLVGLIAIPVMMVGTYLHGPIAVPFTILLLMVSFALWAIAGLTLREPVINLGVTALVVLWTGTLGSFASLLLSPASYPHRHGVAFVVGAIVLTVAHDVGSFAIGHRFGRHPIAPRVSPGKTREGLAGGALFTLVVAVALVAHLHPFTLTGAIALGIAVAIFAPIGDLFESVAKRDLGLKDMGKILPAHGGIFDRIDAMLFVLPICYLVVRIFSLH